MLQANMIEYLDGFFRKLQNLKPLKQA